MTQFRFLQLHFLTTFGANNLNRDDLSRPKSLAFGGVPRLRISSQCIKRAWRLSDAVQAALAGEVGTRSREAWYEVGQEFVQKGHDANTVVAHISAVREAFEGARKNGTDGAEKSTEEKKVSKKKKAAEGVESLKGDLFFFSASELDFVRQTVSESLNPAGSTEGQPYALDTLTEKIKALPMSGDVAMFGRMVAANNALTIEGAVQVAHPFTVNKSAVEDDYFVAVDDLQGEGVAHISENSFGSGLYYGYVNIDIPLLVKNLGGDTTKAANLLSAMVEAIGTVAPSGKQNTFSARSYASFLMAEVGNAQPRSFADAFLSPVNQDPLTETAISKLTAARDSIEMAFPRLTTKAAVIDRTRNMGTLADIEILIHEALAG